MSMQQAARPRLSLAVGTDAELLASYGIDGTEKPGPGGPTVALLARMAPGAALAPEGHTPEPTSTHQASTQTMAGEDDHR